MYFCICIYVHMYTCTYVHLYAYVSMYICICVYCKISLCSISFMYYFFSHRSCAIAQLPWLYYFFLTEAALLRSFRGSNASRVHPAQHSENRIKNMTFPTATYRAHLSQARQSQNRVANMTFPAHGPLHPSITARKCYGLCEDVPRMENHT